MTISTLLLRPSAFSLCGRNPNLITIRLKSTSTSVASSSTSSSTSFSTSSSPLVLFESIQTNPSIPQGISLLTLNRPSAKNAISTQFLQQLQENVERAKWDTSIRALIIRSLVPKTFCAGADLKERKSMSPLQVNQFLSQLRTTFTSIQNLPFPTITALDGLAMGGGMELSLCTDLRVAGPSATRLGLTETSLGIIPGAGGTTRMTRLIGNAQTKDLIFSSRLLNHREAFEKGIVQYAAENGDEKRLDELGFETGTEGREALGKSLQVVQRWLANGPLAIKVAKMAIDKGSQMDLESSLDFERSCYEQVLKSNDRLEGLKAFAEKRKPVYKGD